MQLKLYAMEQSIAAKITDDYDAKGHNLETLEQYHIAQAVSSQDKVEKSVTRYTLSFHIIFPIFMVIFLIMLFVHLLDKYELYNIRNRLVGCHEKPNTNPSTEHLWIIITILVSFIFVLYVFALDCVAVTLRDRIRKEIFFSQSDNTRISFKSEVFELFQIEYAIPIVMLVYDGVILIALSLFCAFIRYCKYTQRWYYILLAPLACIAVHFYHILLGFIQTPTHAVSIAVFYGIAITVFIATLRVVYISLYCLFYEFQWFSPPVIQDNTKSFNRCVYECRCRVNKCQPYTCPHSFIFLILCFVSVFIAGFLVYVVALFVISPINMAIESAPESLLSINQTVLVFFGAAVTYKIVREDESTILALLVKAMNKATTGMFPKQQKTVQAAVNQLLQATAKQRVQKAAQNLLKTATTNLILAVGVDIVDHRQAAAEHQVQDATYLLIKQKVIECSKENPQEQDHSFNEFSAETINNLIEALFQLIITVIDQNKTEERGQAIIQTVADMLMQECEASEKAKIIQGKIQSLKRKLLALVQNALKQYINSDHDFKKLVQDINKIAEEWAPEHKLIEFNDKEKFLEEVSSLIAINKQTASKMLISALHGSLKQIATPAENHAPTTMESVMNIFVTAKKLADKLRTFGRPEAGRPAAVNVNLAACINVATLLHPEGTNDEGALALEQQLEAIGNEFIMGIGMHKPPVLDYLIQAVLQTYNSYIDNHFIEAVRQGSNDNPIINFKKAVLGLVTHEITTAAKSDVLLAWGSKSGQEKKEAMSSYLLQKLKLLNKV